MYNLFQHREDPSIVCALPDGGRLPPFLRDRAWRFGGKVDDIRAEQLSFDVSTVDAVLRQNGFYIYTRL
ncbi:hypothetical protein [Aureimonas sp. AU4]|jgi:hypothetical protein|uniref:hypothetical protein n=1 Tax=Aureimonas sp. AU4 TaxID=1638163 RepID=UPI0007067F1D|nr:hypothetical protein [Aureimonas sp. AU4]BAT30442.1 hypothetical protein [Aureimonas sp. AU4]